MGATATPTGPDGEVVDPICGEVFPPELAVFKSERDGKLVYFCSETCKQEFDTDPSRGPSTDLTTGA